MDGRLRDYRFLLQALLWLAPVFALWYWLAPWLLAPVAAAVEALLTGFFPQVIDGVTQKGTSFEVLLHMTDRGPDGALLPPGARAQPTFPINALQYAYGWPLLLALTLAAPGRWMRKALYAGLGVVLVAPFVVWGVFFEALKVLVFNAGPRLSAEMGIDGLARELLAVAYQLGYLILPALGPILVWAALHRGFLRDWTLRRGAARASAGTATTGSPTERQDRASR